MIVSNGFFDALLYTFTRRGLIFTDAPPPEDCGLDTFAAFKRHSWGTSTTISSDSRGSKHLGSTDEASRSTGVKTVTVIEVSSISMDMESGLKNMSKESVGYDSESGRSTPHSKRAPPPHNDWSLALPNTMYTSFRSDSPTLPRK